MIQLTSQNICLNARAAMKEDAIRAAGCVLSEASQVEPAYIESMLGRERQANTYLGNGIAIPHGMKEDSTLIRQTGVAVVQFPDGVDWDEGETVRLVVGIAAKSDEHLKILSALTDLLDDADMVDRLASTDDPAEIIAAFAGGVRDADAGPSDEPSGLPYVDVQLRPGPGLHARPATNFVAVASKFSSEIHVSMGGTTVNGKAMASLLKLGAEGGATLRLYADGEDADEALAALKNAVLSGLGEQEEKPATASFAVWKPKSTVPTIKGVAASPGIAVGRLVQLRKTLIEVEDAGGHTDEKLRALNDAIVQAKQQLHDIYASMAERVGESNAAIFHAHEAFLNDPEIYNEASALIKDGHSAPWSWRQVIETRAHNMQRAADLRDVGERVLRNLIGAREVEMTLPDAPCILIAEDLTPSDTAKLDPKRILGFVTASGGPSSHTAIIARALGIPAIVGAGAAVLDLPDDITSIIEGTSGLLYTAPTEDDLYSARDFLAEVQRHRDADYVHRFRPALMHDGHRMEIVANIAGAGDAKAALEAGAEGVGLLRSEFLFLDREAPPTEDEQFDVFSEMTAALGGLPLIIRTLDIGGDKNVPYFGLPKEENPFLGVRGVRLLIDRPELFLPHLRAIYRASKTGPVKIMFPMIATLEELRQAKDIAEKVRLEIGAAPVEFGIMVETPSAAALASEFAKECDFFSIGTNDLTQYTLAMDRMHPALGKQADGLHPSVLRLIDQTVRGAKAAGIWVGACGGVAGEPLGATILTGLGVSELSMSNPSIPNVKAHLRRLSFTDAKNVAACALSCSTAEEVRALSG